MTCLGLDIGTTVVWIPEYRFDTTATTKEIKGVSCDGRSATPDKRIGTHKT